MGTLRTPTSTFSMTNCPEYGNLKAKVLEIHPELKDLGSGKEAREALEKASIEAWDFVDSNVIRACLGSMCKEEGCGNCC